MLRRRHKNVVLLILTRIMFNAMNLPCVPSIESSSVIFRKVRYGRHNDLVVELVV